MLESRRELSLLSEVVSSRWLVALALAVALLLEASSRADAGVLLIQGGSVRRNTLPPFLPMPDGTVLGATEIVLASQRIAFGEDDVLVYNTADGVVSPYGETSTLALDSLSTLFSGLVMIADPRTLRLSAFANQDSTLEEVLAEPGFVVMIEVGPGAVPASAISLRAGELRTSTPGGVSTPTPTASHTSAPTGVPTATDRTPATVTPATVTPPTVTPGPATPSGSATESPTPTATVDPAQPCSGDCNNDGTVTVDELIRAVNIGLGSVPAEQCIAADADANQMVTINEIVAAVDRALRGCNG